MASLGRACFSIGYTLLTIIIFRVSTTLLEKSRTEMLSSVFVAWPRGHCFIEIPSRSSFQMPGCVLLITKKNDELNSQAILNWDLFYFLTQS